MHFTDSTFGANTLAHFWILKAFLPALVRSGKGHVVCMSSILGLVGAAQMSQPQYPSLALAQLTSSRLLRKQSCACQPTPDPPRRARQPVCPMLPELR